MADARTFPKIPATVWWQLRRRFHQSVPKQVGASYLQTVLGVQEGHAKNLIPQLEAIGLIGENGAPTALANQWRTDEGYAKACRAIVEAVYPNGLTDAVPPDGADVDSATRWFMTELNVGESAAKQMARFYVLVAKADMSEADSTQTRKASDAGSEPKRKRRDAKQTSPKGSETTPGDRQAKDSTPDAPDLRIAVQVHIPSDATPQQIDAIFESMAKHLYGRR